MKVPVLPTPALQCTRIGIVGVKDAVDDEANILKIGENKVSFNQS